MEHKKQKISDFEQLEVWKVSQETAIKVYEICKKLPSDEKFGLVTQLKRASSSISANIAEGFGRRSIADKKNFYTIAYGSLLETRNHIKLARKLNYLSEKDVEIISPQLLSNQKLLSRFIASTSGLK